MTTLPSGLRPWGRFKLVSKDPADESDHLYFYQSASKIGRNAALADIVLDMLFISGIHCAVTMEESDDAGQPVITLHDYSRNGIFINEERVGKGNSAEIRAGYTIHFTKPGIQTKGVSPTIYKFELLKSGLTPENDRLRADLDRVVNTPKNARAGGTVPSTQAQASKKHQRAEGREIEIDVTKTFSTGSSDHSPSSTSKRRRLGDHTKTGDDDLLLTTAQIQKSNQSLRQKLKDGIEREAKMKQSLIESERTVVELTEKLQAAENQNAKLERDIEVKNQHSDEIEQQLIQQKEECEKLQNEMAEMRKGLDRVTNEMKNHEETARQAKDDREKMEVEMATITGQWDASQSKIRSLEEQIRALIHEKRKLEMAIDSVQTRTEQVEEGKRGVHEDNIMLKTRLTSAQQIFKEIQALVARGCRVSEDETAVMAQELEDLRRHSDNSILSSEQSQPTPVQDHFCADTQPEEGDYEQQTLDQEAAAERAGLVTKVDAGVGPFSRTTAVASVLTMQHSISSDLLEPEQQPISTDLSVDETPIFPESKSLSDGSTVSSFSTSSKTPPALPLPLAREAAAPVPSSGTNKPSDGADQEAKEEAKEAKDEATKVDEAEDSTVKEATKQSDKEIKLGLGVTEASAKSKGWLQMLVSHASGNEEDNAAASEGGGIFDDETQLSAGD